MKICFVDNTNFQYDFYSIYSQDLRGAETVLINLSLALSEIGHKVTIINNCPKPSIINDVRWININSNLDVENYDLVISNDESQAIYDSESNLVAKVKRRKVDGGSYSNSSISRGDNGIFLDNNDSTNGGYYSDLEGLDSVNLGGSITIEMVLKNTDESQDTVYFQSIREFIDTNGDDLDDNLGIVTSGFNNNSAFLKLFYKLYLYLSVI